MLDEQIAKNIGAARLDIAWEQRGDPNHPTVLLVMGIAAQPRRRRPRRPPKKNRKVADAATSATVLTLGVAKIMKKDASNEGLELAADGTVSVDGKPIGKLDAGGKLSSVEGQTMMIVAADGSVTMGDGKPLPFKLEEGGGSMTGDEGKSVVIRFGEDGSVTMEGQGGAGPQPGAEPAPTFVAEGCKGPVAKTCALAFMAYMTLSAGEPSPAAEGVEVPAAL